MPTPQESLPRPPLSQAIDLRFSLELIRDPVPCGLEMLLACSSDCKPISRWLCRLFLIEAAR
jgi:hypothetical protein